MSSDTLAAAHPWRTFRWYRGQKHYSGIYWSATMRYHVVYESRLELSRLLFADFDPAVRSIAAQPFLMKAKVKGRVCSHIPDFLLISGDGPVVVDVKPSHLVTRPDVAFTFAWTRRAVEARGWRYEVWTEPGSVELENIRFLAGCRRDWLFDEALLHELRGMQLEGCSLEDVVAGLPARDPAEVRSAVLHLLWRGELVTDLSTRLGARHRLGRPA